MKRCPVCQAVSEGRNFCPRDGARLEEVPESTPESPALRGAARSAHPAQPTSAAPVRRDTAQDTGPGYLSAVLPTGEVVRFLLDRPELTVGKGVSNVVMLHDAAVSRSHAVIRLEEGQWVVVDLASKNGIYVNEVRVHERAVIRPGDSVLIGQTHLSIVLPNGLERPLVEPARLDPARVKTEPRAVPNTGSGARGGEALPEPILLDGRYELERVIARGSSGTIYSAFRVLLGDNVAVKVLKPELVKDAVAIERYRRGAHVAARVRHRNSLQIFDFGRSPEGAVYIVMELLTGRTLRDVVRGSGGLPLERALGLFAQICAATAAVNAEGIVLRDMKPESIFVETNAAGGEIAKVGGYGFARLDTKTGVSTLGAPAKMLGAPQYMPPEQWLDQPLDDRTNVYSLGVLFFEMLAGRPPFDAGTRGAIADQHLNAPTPGLGRADLGRAEQALEAVIRRATAKQQRDRYATAADLASAAREAGLVR